MLCLENSKKIVKLILTLGILCSLIQVLQLRTSKQATPFHLSLPSSILNSLLDMILETLKPTICKVQEKSHTKFGHASNSVILLHIVEGVDDGIRQVRTLGQIEASQRDTPILCHVHMPFVGHVITLSLVQSSEREHANLLEDK